LIGAVTIAADARYSAPDAVRAVTVPFCDARDTTFLPNSKLAEPSAAIASARLRVPPTSLNVAAASSSVSASH
jgi:hypothetical protein